MKNSTIISLVGVAAVMLVIGMALGSVTFPAERTQTILQRSTVTESTTSNSTVTIISLATQIKNVTIQGTFDSNFYEPLGVVFYYTPCISSFPVQGPILCGKMVNATLSEVLAHHILGGIAYGASFSIIVPNNENYIVEVSLLTQNNTVYNSNCPTSCTFDVAFLPLNSTVSVINNYNIQCNSDYVGNQSVNSAQISCYTHYGDMF